MRARSRRGLVSTLAVIAMVLLSTQALQAMGVASSSTTTTTSSAAASSAGGAPASLLVSVVPPDLPADGGTYQAIVVSLENAAGSATLALNGTLVFLTSSEASVGNVTASVTIPRGAGFALANFTTSDTPGVTSISASSSGLGAASAQVSTSTPSGFATTLSVLPVPGTQEVGQSGQGTLLIETLDAAGFPAQASSGIDVTLSSSNNGAVSLPTSSFTIPSGAVLSSVPYDVGLSPGAATITGSASGFRSGSGTVTVEGASPFALKIFAQPDPVATSTAGRLVVTLVDPNDDPAPAPETVSVTITSSNTTVVSSTQTATIPTGKIYTIVPYTSGPTAGTANLTASSPGLVSAYALVSVAAPVVPTQLSLIAAPNPVLADQSAYQSVVVLLTDASGQPAVATSGVSVTLTSSDSAVGNVTQSLDIPSGSSYGVATFSSTYFVGSTFITASAQNLQSASESLSSYGPVPTEVAVQALPSTLPADGGAYSALEVVLEDAGGQPAVAPTGVTVQLASSATGIATVSPTVVIPAGQSYVLTDVSTTISPGTATITATSSGFQSSSSTLTTASPAPSQIGMYLAPSAGIQSLGGRGDAVLAVQLQDSTSSPARARQDTQVTVTSANSSVITKPITLDVPAGADYASTLVTAAQAGSAVLTASAGGLASATATLSVISLPVSVALTSSAPVVAIGTPTIVQVQVEVMGSPLEGANVTITATSGSMSSPVGVTNAQGQFSDTFIPTQNGVATLTAVVQDPVLGNQTTGTNILVTPPGGAGVGTTSKGLGVLGIVLPIVLVVVIIAIVVVSFRRIIKKKGAAAEEFEEKDAG